MPIIALHPCQVHKMHSAFPWEKKNNTKKNPKKHAKTISLYLFPVRTCISLLWDGRARSCTQHSDGNAARTTRAAPARSLVRISRTFSHCVAARGPDPALSSLELYPWQMQPGHSNRFTSSNVKKSAPGGPVSPPPRHRWEDPRWVEEALDGSP